MSEFQPTAAADDDASGRLVARIRQVWAEVLDLDIAPVDVNFFEAGGDSLLLIVLLERINELGGTDLEAADLFQHSTVLAQAELLAAPRTRPELAALGAHDRGRLLGRSRRA
jgi:aryl carrier-like protein